MNWHLAQINVGRLIAPIDDQCIAGFVSQLDPINALADKAPGFVWRLQSGSGNATDISYNDDPGMMVNMSVWESLETDTPELAISYWASDPGGFPWVCRSKGVLLVSCGPPELPEVSVSWMR